MSKTSAAPTPAPGHFGHFPQQFGLYFRASAQDKKTHYFFLGTSPSAPVYAFSVHKGLKRTLQATLHSSPEWTSAPLATFGIEGIWKGVSVITLPALSDAAGGAPTVVRVKDKGSLKEEKFVFPVPVGEGGEENFEWRGPGALKPTPGVAQVKRLTRQGSEVVLATWTEELDPVGKGALGYFAFVEGGGSAQLGGYWTLVAVATGIRLAQVKWEASAAAEQMIKGAGKVVMGAGGLVGG